MPIISRPIDFINQQLIHDSVLSLIIVLFLFHTLNNHFESMVILAEKPYIFVGNYRREFLKFFAARSRVNFLLPVPGFFGPSYVYFCGIYKTAKHGKNEKPQQAIKSRRYAFCFYSQYKHRYCIWKAVIEPSMSFGICLSVNNKAPKHYCLSALLSML